MKTLAALLIVMVAVTAPAKTTKRVPPDVALEQKPDRDLNVPRSQLNLQHYAVPEEIVTVHNIELSASNWSPNNFGWTAAQVANAGNFQNTSAQITLNYWQTAWNMGHMTLSPKFGLSFAQLAREGTLEVLGHENRVKQTMNLYTLRVGAELAPVKDLLGLLQPFLDASLLPYWQQVQHSEYGLAENRTGLALEAVAGVAWRSPKIADIVGARNIGFELGLEGTQGLGANFAGIGVFAGSRLEL